MHNLPSFPPFDPAASYAATGRTALFYLLSHGETSSYMLDDASLSAAADYVSTAQTARDISAPAIARLTALQAALRGVLRHRQQLREATRLQFAAMFETFDAAMVADVAPAAAVPDVPAITGADVINGTDALRAHVASCPDCQPGQPCAVLTAAVEEAQATLQPAPVPAAAAVPAGWRAMSARFASQCQTCRGYIAAGDPILYRKGTGALHAHCSPAAPPSGGGGAKVPRKPRPTGGAPAGKLAAPVAAPVAVPALAPVAVDDWAF